MTSRGRRDATSYTILPPDRQDETQWKRDVTDALNAVPALSIFSHGNPNSSETATVGTLGFNAGAVSSATSVLWIKQIGSSNTGWAPLG